MKDTTKAFLTGIAATALPVLCFGLWHSVHTADWLICNIKNPGKSALLEIKADMDARRYDIAKQKIDSFARSWEEFSSGFVDWTRYHRRADTVSGDVLAWSPNKCRT